MIKIYIIGHRNIDTLSIGIELQSTNDSLSVSPHFTTDKDSVTEYKYYLDKETVNISYKNNALITVMTDDNESYGITYDDYYNNDIFCMTIADFNVMPDKLFRTTDDEDNDFENLVVWVDSSTNVDRRDIIETDFLSERLESLNYLYFCNEQVDTIVNVINEYLNSDLEDKEKILLEYS